MRALILTGLLAAAAAATQLTGGNIRRQSDCSSVGLKACGVGCVPLSYTCCPDQREGCPAGKFCSLGDNGQYGCCPNGQVCRGPGGAVTSTIGLPGGTKSVTDISTIPAPGTTPPAPTYTVTATPTYPVSSPTYGTGAPTTYYTNTTTTSSPTSVVTAGANPAYGAGSAAGMLGAVVVGLLFA